MGNQVEIPKLSTETKLYKKTQGISEFNQVGGQHKEETFKL